MNFKIDINSVKFLCRENDQAMIYGWDYCKYDDVYRYLKGQTYKQNPIIKKSLIIG